MTPELFLATAIVPGLSLLPADMDTREARAMILAICLQESLRLIHREQINGPARGFAQFEMTGIRGVLHHHASKDHIRRILRMLAYDFNPTTSYRAIKHNDVLCACYARLALWALPWPLPGKHAPGDAWNQYIAAWKPGKPHPETWDEHFYRAWETV